MLPGSSRFSCPDGLCVSSNAARHWKLCQAAVVAGVCKRFKEEFVLQKFGITNWYGRFQLENSFLIEDMNLPGNSDHEIVSLEHLILRQFDLVIGLFRAPFNLNSIEFIHAHESASFASSRSIQDMDIKKCQIDDTYSANG